MAGVVTTRTYALDTPRWRSPSALHLRTLGAGVATVIWLLLYGWLFHRLWTVHAPFTSPLNLGIVIVLVVLGVVASVTWWMVARHWLQLLRPVRWRALTVEQMLELSPPQFEQYVADRIFARQGFTAINTRDVKDGGIDVELIDEQGRRAVVQCKRYRGTVGEETVRDLYGTMIHSGATGAYLVTTGTISQAARRWAADKPIDLIDGERLVYLARTLPISTR